jgi:acyl-CoA reductase-like NAD-dependent aldehyde dehydrogenase
VDEPSVRRPAGCGICDGVAADYGPLVTREALDRVRNYIDIGVKEGATLAVDGRGFRMQGYENSFYIGGSLFDNVTPNMRIYKEEIFGPVLSVVRSENYEDALSLASNHEYGNGVAIFIRDGDTARDFIARVNVGMVGVNVPIPVPITYHPKSVIWTDDMVLPDGSLNLYARFMVAEGGAAAAAGGHAGT